MKLSISNIAWDESYDDEMYQYIAENNFEGIEIAPTRLVSTDPYNNIMQSVDISNQIKEKYQLDISSMQSIWFGRTENIFKTKEEREILINYTKKAINYAAAIECKNLVFGCPKNRNMEEDSNNNVAIEFFNEIGNYALDRNVVIALEPNPVIYNTNFINNTKQAIQFVKEVNSKGLLVNMDLGTIIWNKEDLKDIVEDIELIHHIHISEPYLEKIEKRELHNQLKNLLKEKNYKNYVSIEMKNLNNIDYVKKAIQYVNEVMR